ncbi:calcipressin-1 [Hydra vulgaris]|nr:calcipressin-1-like [Hydra vulgaris]
MISSSFDDNEEEEKPNCVVVQNFLLEVFTNKEARTHFESLFANYQPINFTYLPSFSRVIVAFQTLENAKLAQLELHGKNINEKCLKVYMKELPKKLGSTYLALPKAEKLFLISPPSSPPVGWEPVEEPIPVVNYDLISAVAHLEIPGKPVELVSQTSLTPSIVVVGCEDPISRTGKSMISMSAVPPEELQTKRPPLKN